VALGMLIEGEGTISLRGWNKRRGRGKGSSISPVIQFNNSSPELVQYVIDIFKRFGAKSYVEHQKQRSKGHKLVYKITVFGISRVYRILTVLKKYLLSKRGQADIVLEFIEGRLNKGKGPAFPYVDHDYELVDKIRILNHRGVSETEHCEPHRFNLDL
jgi:LAGLIDADG-like domain